MDNTKKKLIVVESSRPFDAENLNIVIYLYYDLGIYLIID